MGEFVFYLSLIPILMIYFNKNFLRSKSSNYISSILIYSIILILVSFEFIHSNYLVQFLSINDNTISLNFVFNSEYNLMSSVVLGISILVIAYSSKFIDSENFEAHTKYFLFLIIFITSMFLFTLSNDLFSSFILWEFLGLSSYFLIGFWNKDNGAIKSSTIAFWVTRLGDLFFLSGIIVIFSIVGTLDIGALSNIDEFKVSSALEVSMLCIVIGVLTKSAQFPFNIWLPKAMKGPTPVSALIHSATMVVAGILLLYKLYPILSSSEMIKNTLLYAGIISAVASSIVAFYEEDLKKILAFSTISHIGLMFIGLGIGRPDLAYFHMFSHSFFKSMLFLFAGIIIVSKGSSYLKDLKSSISINSVLGVVLLVGCLSLSSIYFFTGSYSKEFIIFSLFNNQMHIEATIVLIGTFFTALYSAKIFLTIISFDNTNKTIRKASPCFTIPLIILGSFSLLGPITYSLFSENVLLNQVPHTFLGIVMIQILTIASFVIYYKYPNYTIEGLINIKESAYKLLDTEKIYFEIYEKVFKSTSLFIAWFDRNIIDGVINYIPFKLVSISKNLMGLQDGLAKRYATRAILFFLLLILVLSILDKLLLVEVLA